MDISLMNKKMNINLSYVSMTACYLNGYYVTQWDTITTYFLEQTPVGCYLLYTRRMLNFASK